MSVKIMFLDFLIIFFPLFIYVSYIINRFLFCFVFVAGCLLGPWMLRRSYKFHAAVVAVTISKHIRSNEERVTVTASGQKTPAPRREA